MSSDEQNPPRRLPRNLLSIILLVLLVGVVAALILPAIQAKRGPRRFPLANNVKQVGLAAQLFATVGEGQLPPLLPGQSPPTLNTQGGDSIRHESITLLPGQSLPTSKTARDSKIKRPISFLTSLLPYLEQGRLYKLIDTSVVWTHPKNQKPYGVRVSTFEWPGGPMVEVEYSNEKTPAGYAITYLAPSSRIVSRPGDPFRMQEITDGTASTVLLGTIDDSRVPAWGDPGNRRDPALGFGGGPYAFGGLKSGAVVSFADGHVSVISKKIDPEVARALATPAGGEDVDPKDWQ